jgi:hypothetical protein
MLQRKVLATPTMLWNPKTIGELRAVISLINVVVKDLLAHDNCGLKPA